MKRYNGHTLSMTLIALAFSLLPGIVFSLGFGDIKLYSYLNEPLDAEIQLVGVPADLDPSHIIASLASQEDFKRIQLDRPYLLTQLRFSVLKSPKSTVIQIKSDSAIQEPFLEFLAVLNWPEGRLVKGYTLLLDPAPMGSANIREVPANNDKEPQLQRQAPIKSSNNKILLNPMQVASLETPNVTDVPRLSASNHAMVENLENLFEQDAQAKREALIPAIQKSPAVSIESSQTANVMPEANTNTFTQEESLTALTTSELNIAGLNMVGFTKNRLLLGSGLALLLGVACTVWLLKRARETLPLEAVEIINGHTEKFEIFDNELTLKLELARQYLQINDTTSAKEILNDVMSRGNIKEIEIATELFEKIQAH